MFSPTHVSANYYKFFYDLAAKEKVDVICLNKSLYNLKGHEADFYKSRNVNPLVFNNFDEINNYLDKEKPKSTLIFLRNINLNNTFKNYNAQRIYCFIPEWALKNNMYDWQDNLPLWSIYMLKERK